MPVVRLERALPVLCLHPHFILPRFCRLSGGTWLYPLDLSPTLTRPPSGSSDTINSYLWRGCMQVLDLAPSVPSAPLDCCGRGPVMSSSTAMPLGRGWRQYFWFARHAVIAAVSPTVLARSGGGGGFRPFSTPILPPPVTLSPLASTPGVLSPRGNASTPGMSMPCSESNPPSHSLVVSPGVYRHYVGLAAASVSPHFGGLARHSVGLAALPSPSHSIGIACRVFLPSSNPLPSRGSLPMAVSHSCLVGGCGGGVASVAPAGRCVPMCAIRAVFR